MALRRTADVSWLSVYPVVEEARGLTADRAVFVNVGGGIGHQCAEFKRAHPDIPGHVVLEDLQHSIDAALPTPGVENIVHNFFEKQPIEGILISNISLYLLILPPPTSSCPIGTDRFHL
jgi:hypothetical protein